MIRRRFLSAPLLILAAGPQMAQAEEATHKQVGQYVDLQPVALPILADGQLVNYVFVYVRINLTTGANAPRLRDKEPYFRDALVRAGHRAPFTQANDYTRLDEHRLKATLLQAASAIGGPGTIASIELLPGGGPMRRTGLPKPRLASR